MMISGSVFWKGFSILFRMKMISADKILSGLPEEIILDALEKQTSQGLYVPPNILKMLQRLKKISDKFRPRSGRRTSQ